VNRRLLQTLIRVLVSASLITFILTRVDIREVWTALRSATLWLIVVALLVLFVRILVSAYRWQIMLSTKDIKVSVWLLTNYYLVGGFFNLFLPTVLGGDVVRGYELARSSRRVIDSASTVIMERILGFLALFVMCWACFPFGYHLLAGTSALPIVVATSLAFFAFTAVILNRRIMRGVIALASVIKRWNLQERLTVALGSLHSLAQCRAILVKAFILSAVYQFAGVVSTYLISEALTLNVPFLYFLIVMPVIWVLMMLPISISGIGVREGAFVLFFTQVGVSEERAVLLSLLFFAVTVIIGLVGGVIFAWGGYRNRDKTGLRMQ
jgi:uncharacterized protein (TIRG00374 family)